MPHDPADQARREAARDRGGVGPQEAQSPAAGDTCQEAEAVTEFQPVRDIVSERVANASRDTLVRVTRRRPLTSAGFFFSPPGAVPRFSIERDRSQPHAAGDACQEAEAKLNEEAAL
jgi:hypothetical protein